MTAMLRSMGGLYEAQVLVHRPNTREGLAQLFESAERRGVPLTLVGAQRSFGEHFLPPLGGEGISTAAIGGPLHLLEREADGSLWVRAPASLTFEQLCAGLPGYIPFHPPTGDQISLAGALVACSHDAVSFLADDVRAFSVLTADGRVHECSVTATGVAGELFRALPGSFGALGAILEVEIRMRRVLEHEQAEITVLEKGPTPGYLAVERLEATHASGEYPLGRGLFFFGRRGTTVLLCDKIVSSDPRDTARTLVLADDSTVRNIVAQGLANRFPALAHRLQPWLFKRGRRFRTTLYAFCFYQRSYDRAFEYLSRSAWLPFLLRRMGVDPRLTVCHQTFAIPVSRRTDFLDLYFRIFDRYPDLESRLELQDMIRLPDCSWPLHPTYGMPGGAYLFTVSFSVRRGEATEARAREFLTQVSIEAFEALGVKVHLLKQIHCDLALLRRMHQPVVEALQSLRRRLDPRGLLTSRLLRSLGV